ncbi:MAG: peptidoglycan-binding protein [Clostridia bacterium]|nr:peptidoglycan-binding protein [Clostridia bacterium]
MPNPQTDTNINHTDNISELQKHLREISYRDERIPIIAIDGIYSPQTTASVEAFQQFYGLPVTGEVNRATWDEIFRVYLESLELKRFPLCIYAFSSPTVSLNPGDSSDAVYFLQIMLSSLSNIFPNIPDVDINGRYDNKTQAAVRFMQDVTQINANGVNKDTWNAIVRIYNTYMVGD